MKGDNPNKKAPGKRIILEEITPLVNKAAEKLGLIVLETTFTRESGHYILRIYIYNPNKPVSHEECAQLTHLLNDKLEEVTSLDIPYSLEVSSPGVNRTLKNKIEFEIFKGKDVKVIFNKATNAYAPGETLIGKLTGLSDDDKEVIIEINNRQERYNITEIKAIQLEG